MTSGVFTFPFHNQPVGWLRSIEERLEEIDHKPEHERPIRKHCIKEVPEELLPAAYVQAWKAYGEADKLSTEAREDRREAPSAYMAFNNAWTVGNSCRNELLAIALKLVPDAPWDSELQCLVFKK